MSCPVCFPSFPFLGARKEVVLPESLTSSAPSPFLSCSPRRRRKGTTHGDTASAPFQCQAAVGTLLLPSTAAPVPLHCSATASVALVHQSCFASIPGPLHSRHVSITNSAADVSSSHLSTPSPFAVCCFTTPVPLVRPSPFAFAPPSPSAACPLCFTLSSHF
jgi:hypothetical protein